MAHAEWLLFFAPGCVIYMYGIGSASHRNFDLANSVHSWTKYFLEILVVILNSSLHYQIFEFDTNIIQILVWITSST